MIMILQFEKITRLLLTCPLLSSNDIILNWYVLKRLGGIMRCDTIATGIIDALNSMSKYCMPSYLLLFLSSHSLPHLLFFSSLLTSLLFPPYCFPFLLSSLPPFFLLSSSLPTTAFLPPSFPSFTPFLCMPHHIASHHSIPYHNITYFTSIAIIYYELFSMNIGSWYLLITVLTLAISRIGITSLLSYFVPYSSHSAHYLSYILIFLHMFFPPFLFLFFSTFY